MTKLALIGEVVTMSSHDDVRESVIWEGERITVAGSARDVLGDREIAPLTAAREICVVPGFIDPHVHLDGTPVERPLDDCSSKADLLDRVAGLVRRAGAGEWCVARGSIDGADLWPTRADLDRVAPANPVFVSSGFTGVANSMALAAAGIGRLSPPPAAGYVGKDGDGQPDGVLSDLAIRAIDKVAPAGTESMYDRLARGTRNLAQAGITSAHQIVNTASVVRAFTELRSAGELPVRMGFLFKAYGHATRLDSLLNLGLSTGFGDDWMKVQGVKFLFDGGYPQGAMRYPGASRYDAQAVFRTPPPLLWEMVDQAHASGLRCAVHANGAQAVDLALDAFEYALSRHPRDDHRHRIEHAANTPMSPARIARMKALGLVAVPNPPILFRKLASLREDAADSGSAPVNIRDFLAAGAPVAVGSDYAGVYPVEPLASIAELVTRRATGQVRPQERLTPWEALGLYTATGAWLGFEEGRKGKLLPGFLADFTVLSANPLTCPPDELEKVRVLGTVVGGRPRYWSADLGPAPVGAGQR
jgi:predicted amidohydrolase YtcJ